jgi:hypothetical protein
MSQSLPVPLAADPAVALCLSAAKTASARHRRPRPSPRLSSSPETAPGDLVPGDRRNTLVADPVGSWSGVAGLGSFRTRKCLLHDGSHARGRRSGLRRQAALFVACGILAACSGNGPAANPRRGRPVSHARTRLATSARPPSAMGRRGREPRRSRSCPAGWRAILADGSAAVAGQRGEHGRPVGRAIRRGEGLADGPRRDPDRVICSSSSATSSSGSPTSSPAAAAWSRSRCV